MWFFFLWREANQRERWAANSDRRKAVSQTLIKKYHWFFLVFLEPIKSSLLSACCLLSHWFHVQITNIFLIGRVLLGASLYYSPPSPNVPRALHSHWLLFCVIFRIGFTVSIPAHLHWCFKYVTGVSSICLTKLCSLLVLLFFLPSFMWFWLMGTKLQSHVQTWHWLQSYFGMH